MQFHLSMILILSALASSQTAVEMSEQPHSSLLLRNPLVQVFRMSLNANDQTYVLHKHNFLMVALDDCDLSLWREGQSNNQNFPFKSGDVRFYFEGRPIGTRNNRASLCRTMVVEFLDPKVTTYGYQWSGNNKWDYGMDGIPAPVDPQAKFAHYLRLGSVVAAVVQLRPGDSFSPPKETNNQLLIPITIMDLQQSNQSRITKPAGEVVWTTADQKSDLVNAGDASALFVVVEFLKIG